MKVGIITPANMTRYSVTDIHYCIPSLIAFNEDYRYFFRLRIQEGDTVIMDLRKPGWKREPEDIETCKIALIEINPTFVILPSYAYNYYKTEKVALEYQSILGKLKPVLCLDGTNIEDITDLVSLAKSHKISKFAIPSHMYRIYTGKHLQEPIFIDNHISIDEIEKTRGIILTSLPIRLGLQGRLLKDNLPSPPSLNFHETEDRFPEVISENIKEVLKKYKIQIREKV